MWRQLKVAPPTTNVERFGFKNDSAKYKPTQISASPLKEFIEGRVYEPSLLEVGCYLNSCATTHAPPMTEVAKRSEKVGS